MLEKLATLPLDLRAPVAAKGAQIVVKRLVAAIPPVKLETEPGSKTDALERLDLIAKTEIDTWIDESLFSLAICTRACPMI
ncbi:MAG: hypothetical protein E6J89_06465 [Deltaproteobacteria bacterium]|nr:MAG: hypothetical protein E6J89_06465 [Deltaproteobacteria bacterium]